MRKLTLILCFCLIGDLNAQVAFSELSKIGIIKGRNYRWKIKGSPIIQPMVIRLIPNLGNITTCTKPVIDDYELLLKRILDPIGESLKRMKSAISVKQSEKRFWGAVIGGVALGVATSAQITAGIALHNSLENAAAVEKLKEAIRNSNDAITQLKTATQDTVVALSALQEQINTQIIPMINKLSCDSLKTTLALKLNQYFSEISLIFGPNLRDPASETLSIQALSKAFNDDFETILKTLGYTDGDFLDVLESDSIRARIIDVDTTYYYIVLQIEYPILTEVENAVIQKFNLISFNNNGMEWFPLFPNELLIRLGYISNINIAHCSQTSLSILCSEDTSSPISTTFHSCITGNLSSCIATRNINSEVSRYALSDGVLFVNCLPIVCRCETTGQAIIQEKAVSNIMISSEYCPEVYVDSMFIMVGKKYLNRTIFSSDFEIGNQISIDPIDIGSDISSIQSAINKTQESIDKSNALLNSVNSNIIGKSGFITIWIICGLSIAWLVISLFWMIYLTKSLSDTSSLLKNQQLANTLSGLIKNQ
ncbi:fusion protein [Wufeng Murina leucogaster paramyxovirus 1]|nr:fusion protein [Wufeng Murina leucogaster paramyxovirus 1]